MENGTTSIDMATRIDRERMPAAGILTQTVIRSPVIRWILHARIRQKRYNDVVFIGDDFIHVKQVTGQGQLQHIATKSNFDARIRAAKTFSNEKDAPDEDLFIKTENNQSNLEDLNIPPQCLVLTLDSNDLLFLYLVDEGLGRHRFVEQAFPMPVFDRILFQPGEHLAVDPLSRALAVAASEREVVIYSAKSKEQMARQLRSRDQNWCPISFERPLQVEGAILHMDFLIAPSQDADEEDEGHIILLLVVVDQRRSKAVWIDWYYTSDLHHAQIHTATPLGHPGKGVPSLLIPLRNAGFLLVTGHEIERWKNIISGSPSCYILQTIDTEPSDPGSSPRQPLWANWCRPKRGQTATDADYIYLVREDGRVHLLQVEPKFIESSHAGDLPCHVGSGFASLGDSRNPDILAVAGDMSSGQVYTIGHWFTPLRLSERSRHDTMEMELIEMIPNWASVTDMVVSRLSGRYQRSQDSIFVTSGRQPYGAITELRKGLEARLSVFVEIKGLRAVTAVWALPLTSVGHVLLLVSSPNGTRLFDVHPDADLEIEEIDENTVALDSTHTTLAAACTSSGKLVQITDKSICISAGTSANFEDSARVAFGDDSTILAAAIDLKKSIAVTAERLGGAKATYALVCYKLNTEETDTIGDAQVQRGQPCAVPSEVLCLNLAFVNKNTFVLVSTADGHLIAASIAHDGSIQPVGRKRIPSSRDSEDQSDDLSICDSIAVLHPTFDAMQSKSRALVVCALRRGLLYTVTIEAYESFLFKDEHLNSSSCGPIKLVQPADESFGAYALSGQNICLLSWDGQNAKLLEVKAIWISDKLRPELAQGTIAACTHMPAEHLLSSPDLADSLVMISGDELFVTTLDPSPESTVPRQISVSGTPNRLIYAEQHRCLVCASLQYDIRAFPSERPHARPEEKRQIWPVINFIPARASQPNSRNNTRDESRDDSEDAFKYHMEPGERVFALLEWSWKDGEKTYSFIIVGGSYTKSNGKTRGRITWLQPVVKDWRIEDVREVRTTNVETPVYALALLDQRSFVACVGQTVIVFRLDTQTMKWEPVCDPLKLASPGISVSVDNKKRVFVSTAEDSLVVLRFDRITDGDNAGSSDHRLVILAMPPRADALLSHLANVTHGNEEADGSGLTLASTKSGQVFALDTSSRHPTESHTAKMVFEAQLSRSLTRIRQCNTRPWWKPSPPEGVLTNALIGCSADGALTGMALIDHALWRRLSWLQRLCEWNSDLSPHSYQCPVYNVTEATYARDERAMPIGLSSASGDEIVMRTAKPMLGDGHIDGDILERLLTEDGAETLREILRQTAERKDRAGEWVKVHLEQELAAVEDIIRIVRDLHDSWI